MAAAVDGDKFPNEPIWQSPIVRSISVEQEQPHEEQNSAGTSQISVHLWSALVSALLDTPAYILKVNTNLTVVPPNLRMNMMHDPSKLDQEAEGHVYSHNTENLEEDGL